MAKIKNFVVITLFVVKMYVILINLKF